VISVHCHWSDESVRSEEGLWLRAKIFEFLNTPGETQNIFLMGDYNGEHPCPPHFELLDGGGLHLLPKQNGEGTHAYGGKIDHCSVSEAAKSQLPIQSAFVIRPEHYDERVWEFVETYSDHLPVFIEIGVYQEPGPAGHWLLE
jgi:hypothetical protein